MPCETWILPAEAEGQKAETYVRKACPQLTESALRRLFSKRDVLLDARRISRDTPLHAGQQLKIYLPASAEQALDIVWEDGDILLVNKRPGLSVEADGSGIPSLTELCLRHTPWAAPCHRLDVRTGGLCLFAKNPRALEILLRVFRERTLDKRYICLVQGMPKPPSASCSAWLLKDSEAGRVRILDHPLPGAKAITTEYETLESGPVSRLSVHLVTGRTHQIRAHLAALGHPILGDDVYGDRSFNRQYKARSLKLCAVSLRLDTGGAFPALDGREFTIDPPF